MHISNSYSLQRKIELKKGLFDKLHYVNLLLKIAALLSLLGIIYSLWMLFLPAALVAADIALGIYRSKLLFTYKYRYHNGVFYVVKEDLDGKETVLEKVPVRDVKSCLFVENGGDSKKYYSDDDDFGDDRPMEIEYNDKKFTVLADDYLYSIVCYGMKETK
ncbi:MAG: hypothetical protein J5781_06350 [Clostridia bacterium]|nr:hypothetical protein [Clostridia bacterium]